MSKFVCTTIQFSMFRAPGSIECSNAIRCVRTCGQTLNSLHVFSVHAMGQGSFIWMISPSSDRFKSSKYHENNLWKNLFPYILVSLKSIKHEQIYECVKLSERQPIFTQRAVDFGKVWHLQSRVAVLKFSLHLARLAKRFEITDLVRRRHAQSKTV